jgi:hypothetical protein
MDYSRFRRLVTEGEKRHVDFKIHCDAFLSPGKFSKAELARDICAMANNGNMASYIIVGVSDDGRQFRSSDNQELTDDHLQDFCKKAIFPPPKVKVHRKMWKRALSAHKGKKFLIIQVGPNRRQVFRLAQDFIDYGAKTCYRRNEVWIRRGATTDLATPEEIVRLASGQSLQETKDDAQKKSERESFSHLSQRERQSLIASVTSDCLRKLGYKKLPRRDWISIQTWIANTVHGDVETRCKRIDPTAMIVYVLRCLPTLTSKELEKLYWSNAFDSWGFARWNELPNAISKLTRAQIESVRRLCIVPVLRPVPAGRIEKALPALRRAGTHLHYYQPNLAGRRYRRDESEIPSSSELLVLAGCRSEKCRP